MISDMLVLHDTVLVSFEGITSYRSKFTVIGKTTAHQLLGWLWYSKCKKKQHRKHTWI